ncbi:MAG: ParB/RepB/Spo0J family partition protein [Caulobacteraceae bacterium]
MAQVAKIALSSSRDIPFNKLVLSQSNVRRIKTGVSIEELAEDIARRTLLQGLSVRPVLDAADVETGMFEVPAGGRRFRALELLVRQKRLARTAPVPCVVRSSEDVTAEEDSLAENIQRAPLHPLDQFRAFQALREQGAGEEEIAARFFVPVQVVRQRLKLASASPKLHDIYAGDGMTLEQLMAFTVAADHTRQEEVWEALSQGRYKEPYQIRRMLTDGAIRACDKRAQFVGVEAYEQAGGVVLRDLFQHDDGGWLQDPVLLDRLVAEKLAREAETIAAEGWMWVEVDRDFPYGHTNGLRRLVGETAAVDDEHEASRDALLEEMERLHAQYEGDEDFPEAVDARLGEIETALEAFQNRTVQYDPAEVARAGVFVSLDGSGVLRIERGYVRPKDEPAVEANSTQGDVEEVHNSGAGSTAPAGQSAVGALGGAVAHEPEPEEDEGPRPIPERLLTELTAHRTLALRDALAGDPDAAFLAVLHVLALNAFYRFGTHSCLEIEAKSAGFTGQGRGLNDTVSAKAITARGQAWADQLPKEPGELWEALRGFDGDSRSALFAHCASVTVNATHEPWNRSPGRLVHADSLAQSVGLDMAAAGWAPTADNYLGRVTKARILDAVREAKGEQAAQLLDHLKKPEMAKEAQRLLADTGWLPEPLRTPLDQAGESDAASVIEGGDEPESLPAFLDGGEAGEPNGELEEPEPGAHAIAAE